MGRTFRDSLRFGAEVFHSLRAILKARGLSTAVGDEGGFAPRLESHEEALRLIVEAGERIGLRPGRDFVLAMDPAASEFYESRRYVFRKGSMEKLSSDEMVDLYIDLCRRYPIASLEDPMAEQDWDGWKTLTSRIGKKIQLVGDDVFVTNRRILSEGVRAGVANAVLIKVNQIGTLTETLDTVEFAVRSRYRCVISHRSGETEDTSISDISVATRAGQIKTGAPSRGERTAKYNRLLRIEEELGSRARFAGRAIFRR